MIRITRTPHGWRIERWAPGQRYPFQIMHNDGPSLRAILRVWRQLRRAQWSA